jgi:hypothetical protein
MVCAFVKPPSRKTASLVETQLMFERISRLLRDRRGTAMAGDWVFVATILVLGAVTGLVSMRQTRLPDLAEALKATKMAKGPSAAK